MLGDSEILDSDWGTTVLVSSPSSSSQSSQDVPSGVTALLSAPSPSSQRTLDNCSPALLEAANKTCSHIPEQEISFDCLFDVCQTGELTAAEDSVEMEFMEVKEAHGVVHFAGHGRCLDANGHSYNKFKVNGTSTDQQCQKMLASLADTSSVRGAEVNPSQECLIVVDPDIQRYADPDTVRQWLNSGWSFQKQSKNESEVGAGIVGSTTGTPGWSCWKLF